MKTTIKFNHNADSFEESIGVDKKVFLKKIQDLRENNIGPELSKITEVVLSEFPPEEQVFFIVTAGAFEAYEMSDKNKKLFSLLLLTGDPSRVTEKELKFSFNHEEKMFLSAMFKNPMDAAILAFQKIKDGEEKFSKKSALYEYWLTEYGLEESLVLIFFHSMLGNIIKEIRREYKNS